MRVVVNYDLCEGNAVCVKVCPEVFEVRDDDRAHLLVERPGEELRAKVETAVRRCPRQALSIVKD
jgi:ferredoxin